MKETSTEQMDAAQVFCPNQHCKARGHIGQGNIVIHGRKRQRYRCKICQTLGKGLYSCDGKST